VNTVFSLMLPRSAPRAGFLRSFTRRLYAASEPSAISCATKTSQCIIIPLCMYQTGADHGTTNCSHAQEAQAAANEEAYVSALRLRRAEQDAGRSRLQQHEHRQNNACM
jgi:hypothetical protein